MNTILRILIAGTILGLAMTAGWQLAGPGEIKRQLAESENQLREARSEIARLKGELSRKSTLLSAQKSLSTESNTVTAGVSKGADSAQHPAAKGAESAIGKSLRKMLEAPGMKAVVKQQQAMQIEKTYGRLFDSFQLNDEEKTAFKQLLADRQAAQTELGLQMMDNSLTPEQRQQANATYQSTKQASSDAIKNFLNDDGDYQAFLQWEDTAPERMKMEMVGKTLFSSSSEPLTADQEQQLIDTMYAARKQSGAQDTSSPGNFDPSKFTEQGLQKTLQTLDANAQTVAQNAAAFLSQGQLQTLASMQSQVRSMTETSMRMAITMFGSKSP